MNFVKVIKLLFPRAKPFNLVFESKMKSFIKGLCSLPEDIQRETEKVFLDLFPETTRAYAEWEKQFAVLFAREQYGDTRIGILRSLWQINLGGQSLSYLEMALQNVEPNLHVYENVLAKNPRDSNAVYSCMCNQRWMVCGNKKAICGYKLGDPDFIPAVIRNNAENVYDIPFDRNFWQNYFFVAGKVVKNSKNEIVYCEKLEVDRKWKAYIEYLILKIKPAHTGAVIFIDWI